MTDAMYQHMIQLFKCCNYCKPETVVLAPHPSPPRAVEEVQHCGLAASPEFLASQLSRRSSLESTQGSSNASTTHSGGGGSQPSLDDDNSESEGLSTKELTSQAALMDFFEAAAHAETSLPKEKESKVTKAQVKTVRQTKAQAKALRMKGKTHVLSFFCVVSSLNAQVLNKGKTPSPVMRNSSRTKVFPSIFLI